MVHNIFLKKRRNTYGGLNGAKGTDKEFKVLRDQEEKATDALSSKQLQGENSVLEIMFQ